MIKYCNTSKVLQVFFDSPAKKFQLREVARRARLGLPSVTLHVKRLLNEGLIKKEKGTIYNVYVANRTPEFKLLKRCDMLERLWTSGLIDFLEKELSPDTIVLFGSVARGEDAEESDLDLFVQAKEQQLELGKFEKQLHRKIAILFEERVEDINKELLNNLINGIVVSGYFRVLK